jgi:hypothetical protein
MRRSAFSIHSVVRRFIAKDGMYAGKAGELACPCSHKKMTIFRGALELRQFLSGIYSVERRFFGLRLTHAILGQKLMQG